MSVFLGWKQDSGHLEEEIVIVWKDNGKVKLCKYETGTVLDSAEGPLVSEKPAEICMELGRKGERKEETEINIQSGMAEEIKLEEQKGVQKSIFASNFATTL